MTKLDLPDGLALPVVSPFPLQQADPDIWAAVDAERHRQMRSIELIASENFVSRAVLEVQGSVLTNKYAEGYPGRRYYGGCLNVDVAERIAIERAQRLFGARHANVQPHSGSQANQGVYLALLAPGDKILGLDLKAGGHLTHGAKVNLSGRWFQALSYGVDRAPIAWTWTRSSGSPGRSAPASSSRAARPMRAPTISRAFAP